MAKLLITAEVNDLAKWEKGFRSHDELFKSYGMKGPALYGTNENNEVAVVVAVDDPVAIMETMSSAENTQAMEADGIKLDTVKVFILDKEYSF